MKLTKKELKQLIENFLLVEQETDDNPEEGEEDTIKNIESDLVKMSKKFKDFEVPTYSQAYNFSVVSKDGGLCLTVEKSGSETITHCVTFKEIAESKVSGSPVVKHVNFINEMSKLLSVVEPKLSRRMHDALAPYVGNFLERIGVRAEKAKFASTYASKDFGVAKGA